MKAFVIEEPNKVVMKDVDIPEIGPEEVLMKTLASGICHSDYDLIEGDYILPLHFPIIPGHGIFLHSSCWHTDYTGR